MESNPETCPRCGSKAIDVNGFANSYECRTFYRHDDSYVGQSGACVTAELRLKLTTAIADKERVEGELESFHLRIYDAFTCPNCRGSKQQAPPFMGESEGPVACEFCKGEGTTNFAQILDNFDKPYSERQPNTKELEALGNVKDTLRNGKHVLAIIRRLSSERGSIVSSADCTAEEINAARDEGRMWVDPATSYGYVLRASQPAESQLTAEADAKAKGEMLEAIERYVFGNQIMRTETYPEIIMKIIHPTTKADQT